MPLPELFLILSAAVAVGVPAYAGAMRGRSYALFSAVILALSLPGAVWVHLRVVELFPAAWQPWLNAAFLWSLVAAGVHLSHLVRARLRSSLFRAAVSVPGQTFVAAGFMAVGWLLVLFPLRALLWLLGAEGLLSGLRWLDLLPFAVALPAAVLSPRPTVEWVRVRLGREGPEALTRLPLERHRRRLPPPGESRPLRIVQISDPHLGPWQSVRGLRRTIERLLAREPDLVLLTGDFLTMESRGSPGALAESLAPLRTLPGRCFAIFGNHDHEALEEVRHGLAEAGVRLLVDDAIVTDTPVGRVQLVGADYRGRERREHLQSLLARHPRIEGCLRVLLLHDPSAFIHVPADDVDLTLSGHTHGGQVGLVSFGLEWTVLSGTRWPDHGLFARGGSRLYVHRGTGFYGFPLRVGVPGEASVMEVWPALSVGQP